MARIDGSKRSVGLPSRRLRPAWAASAVRALRRVASREAPRLPERPPLGCSVDNSRARRRMLLRAARRLCRSNAVVTPRTLMQKHQCHGRVGSALYSRCGPQKVREEFARRAATRGLPRALPRAQQKLLSERVQGGLHTRRSAATTVVTHR